ncbi:glycosyl hydrolase family 95 catalytic domain-containing protein [Jiulongibacter sediminis]|uniref:Alpha-L-fucosidase n=1 Tax=Jiulongibacter sediminis TaxID=1605367 RepID=A0A0P7C6M2_9BACT|nr:glycoside hydrolase N-terminal domain-containing protein [Jiulongibacter sediminis]KPM49049.1 alpha-L-fucosidase [Jiulongibacter sediminis]TBX25563.1 alpha-L-fucosidase [Jiulongibacter sediminis]
MKKILLSLFLLGVGFICYSQENLKLWYDEPAGDVWESALPIANGRQGAMVFGNVEKETFQLNEHTVWSGSPNRNDNPDALEALPEIRKLIFEGQFKAAEQLANEKLITKKSHGQMFQPVGNLVLDFPGHESYTDYYRELDIDNAVARTTYTVNGVKFTREAFTSFPDRVLVIRLTADRPGQISFTSSLNSPHKKQKISTNASGELSLWGVTSDHEGVEGKVEFETLTRVKNEGGRLSISDSTLTVSNANSAIIYVSIATNFNNYQDLAGDESQRARYFMDLAFAKGYSQLLNPHITAYRKFFDRVKLDLGDTGASTKPTDERLQNFRNMSDPSFVTLYYQYGRYLLISSSQPGGQPANLQGIWNNKMMPPWDSKYTININAEMNYWPAERTNLSELHEPFLKMVTELAETGQETAKVMYGATGWVAHHNTDIWRVTGAIDAAFWGMWNSGGGWLIQHLWEHYLYTGDKEFLEKVYPAMRGAALFYTDFLIEHPEYKWLVVAPGSSPENAPEAHQGSSITAGSTMDNQIVFDVFSSVIQAAEVLDKDEDLAEKLKSLRNKLPPMHVGKYNQLQEWLDDVDSPEDHHRHISHLYGLFPSNQISAYRTPELFAAAKNTLLHRGDVSTGWSMGWKVNWWARMQDGDHAYELIKNQLSPVSGKREGGGSYKNLFDAHPPFQIDGNFGCTSGITEMLMQSADGAIHILPALPQALSAEGKVSGLKARGDFEIVNLEWEDGKVTALSIKSNLGGNLRLRTPEHVSLVSEGRLVLAEGVNPNPFYQIEETAEPVISEAASITPLNLKTTYLYDLSTEAGKTYTFTKE